MNEELIKKLFEYLEKGQDFIMDQAPEFIQQLINYEKLSALWAVIICSVLLIGCITAFIICYFYAKPDKYGTTVPVMITLMMSGIGTLPLIGILINSIGMLIKIHIAPKVFLIEYLSRFR